MNINKQDALTEIITIARNNGLTLAEISTALSGGESKAEKSGNTLKKIFGYIGGILILSGIGAFIGMFWSDMGSVSRIFVTLGVGFAVFIMGLAALNDEKYGRAATPLFLIAALLQPFGIIVMLDEISSSGDYKLAILFTAFVMLVQQGAVFWKKQVTVLAFTTLVFFGLFFATLLNIVGAADNINALIVGASLIFLTAALSKTPHAAITPFWYFVSSAVVMLAAYDVLFDMGVDLLFLAVSALMIYLSIELRSRSILVVSTIAMLSYIGKFTAEHFTDSLGWPIALILTGVLFLGIGSVAVRINNKYIKQLE